jgi:hypothetical protein
MSYHLTVRWAQRPEPVSVCASRLSRMLDGLAAVHATLSDWRKQAQMRAAAYKPLCTVPPQLNELEKILLAGRHFASGSGEPAPELGYSISAWNGLNEPRALSIRLHVGSYESRLYPNEVALEGLRRENLQLFCDASLKRALLTVAECWGADWGVVRDWGFEGCTLDPEGRPLLPYGGWLTYLSAELAEKVLPPHDVLAERTPDGGLVMQVSEEPFDAANPTHVTRLDAVQKSLASIQRSLSSVPYAPPPNNK